MLELRWSSLRVLVLRLSLDVEVSRSTDLPRPPRLRFGRDHSLNAGLYPKICRRHAGSSDLKDERAAISSDNCRGKPGSHVVDVLDLPGDQMGHE